MIIGFRICRATILLRYQFENFGFNKEKNSENEEQVTFF